MKEKVLKILVMMETFVIVLELLWIGFCFCISLNEDTELIREYSPDGKYVLYIKEIGKPIWPFGADHLEIRFYESERPVNCVSFRADVRNDGARAGYKVTWLEDGVQIALIGSEQPTAYYILPFMTSEGAKEDTASEDAVLTEETATEE